MKYDLLLTDGGGDKITPERRIVVQTALRDGRVCDERPAE